MNRTVFLIASDESDAGGVYGGLEPPAPTTQLYATVGYATKPDDLDVNRPKTLILVML